MTEKRYYCEDNCTGYYTEFIDKEKELDLNLSNPKKNLTVEEVVDRLNKQEETIQQLQKDSTILIHSNLEYRKENKKLIKMLDNVANYMQKQHKNIPIDDFVEWWNHMATEGLE